jgi:hypothetical protein
MVATWLLAHELSTDYHMEVAAMVAASCLSSAGCEGFLGPVCFATSLAVMLSSRYEAPLRTRSRTGIGMPFSITKSFI